MNWEVKKKRNGQIVITVKGINEEGLKMLEGVLQFLSQPPDVQKKARWSSAKFMYLLTKRGLRIIDFAKQSGISADKLYRFKEDKQKPKMDEAIVIASALGVSLYDLIEG